MGERGAEPTAPARPAGRVLADWLRDHWFVLCCMVVAAVVAVIVRDQVFPHFSPNRDEPVYVLQARTLREGHLTLPVYDDLRFYQPWLTGIVDGRLIFEFPPGWPAFLAGVSLLTGSMVPALPIVAALVVLALALLAREASGSRAVMMVVAGAAVATPMVVIQSGLLVSYLFTLALGAFAGTALLRGARTGRWAPLLAGGVLLGCILLTRPFDALLWGIPFGVYVLVRAWPSGTAGGAGLRDAARRVGWVALGFLPLAVLMAAYNLAVTGSPTRFPIEAADPLNRFGFGERRIMVGTVTVPYSRHDALEALGDNFRHAPPWVLGSWLGIGLALVGVYLARRREATYVLLGLVATFGIGYLFYWGLALMGAGAPLGGPQYYMPMLVPILVLGATTLVACWRWHAWAAALVGIALVAVSVPEIVDRSRVNRDYSAAYTAVHRVLARLDAADALVVVPVGDERVLLTGPPFAMNAYDLGGGRRYAADLGPEVADLVARTDRTPYRVATLYRNGADGQEITANLRRLRLAESGALRITLRVTNPTDEATVTAYLVTDAGVETRVLDRASTRGAAYDVEWTVAASDASRPGAIVLPPGTAWLSAGFRFGPESADPQSPDAAEVVELRWATRATATAVTALRPARRYGLITTPGYGRVLLETVPDAVLRGRIAPAPGA